MALGKVGEKDIHLLNSNCVSGSVLEGLHVSDLILSATPEIDISVFILWMKKLSFSEVQ